MITKTEYTYLCSKGSDMAQKVILLSHAGTLTLWEGSDNRQFDTIGSAEKYLCERYHEVMLDNKADTTIVRIERLIQ